MERPCLSGLDTGCQCPASGDKECEETVQTLLGHFLLYVMAGGERLYAHEIAREFAPHRRIFVCRRRASCAPEHEERSRDLLVLVGRVHFEIDGCTRAIVATRAGHGLRREAAYELVHHDLGSLPRIAAAADEKPFGTHGIDHRLRERLRLSQERPMPGTKRPLSRRVGPDVIGRQHVQEADLHHALRMVEAHEMGHARATIMANQEKTLMAE